jgi:hypothetical protein
VPPALRKYRVTVVSSDDDCYATTRLRRNKWQPGAPSTFA